VAQGWYLLINPSFRAPVVERFRYFFEHMVYEVGIIAHSCGVREPRQLKRFHARVATGPLIRHYHLNKDN